VSAASRGVLDRLRSFTDSRTKEAQDAKRAEVFKAQLDFLAACESYGMAEYVKSLEMTKAAVEPSGVRSMLLSAEQKSTLEDAFIDVKIGAALTPAEVADPALLGRREKLRAAGAAGCDVARVNRFLDAFEQSRNVHRWIRKRRERGLAVPSTFEEYVAAMSADRLGTKASAMRNAMGRVRGQRQMLKKM
jgi:signal recognition particle GTPase